MYSLTHSPAVASCISCLQIKTFCALSLIPIQTHPAHTREGLSISLIVSAVLSLAEQRTLNRERLSPTYIYTKKQPPLSRAVKALKVSQKKVGCNYHRPNYWKNSPWRRTNVSCRGRWSEPKAIFHWASQLWPQHHQTRDNSRADAESAFYLFAYIFVCVSVARFRSSLKLECIENYFYQPRFPIIVRKWNGRNMQIRKNAVLEIKTANLYSPRLTFRLPNCCYVCALSK
jgi:hypothetical protein